MAAVDNHLKKKKIVRKFEQCATIQPPVTIPHSVIVKKKKLVKNESIFNKECTHSQCATLSLTPYHYLTTVQQDNHFDESELNVAR